MIKVGGPLSDYLEEQPNELEKKRKKEMKKCKKWLKGFNVFKAFEDTRSIADISNQITELSFLLKDQYKILSIVRIEEKPNFIELAYKFADNRKKILELLTELKRLIPTL